MKTKTTLVNANEIPDFDINIMRPSIWGNPYILDSAGREDCLNKYKAHLLKSPDIISQLHLLYGKKLGCKCTPLPCHGDLLVQICNSFKCIIAGDRKYSDYETLSSTVTRLLTDRLSNLTIIGGGQTGADTLGKKYADDNNILFLEIPANFKLGPQEGPKRNEKMAKIADACIIFDGGGRGSASMYRIAKQYKLITRKIDVRSRILGNK